MKERRKYVRIESQGEGSIGCSEKTGEKVRFNVRDLSIGGMRIIADCALDEGEVLPMTFSIPGIEGVLSAECSAARQTRMPDGRYEIGIEFKSMDTEIELKLMDHIAVKAGYIVECREYLRCGLRTKVAYSLESDPGTVRECMSADVSSLGLKLIFEETIKDGTELRLQFHLPDETEPLTAAARVAWARHGENDRTEAGIEFQDIDDRDRLRIERFVQKTLESK
jgi:c-di-GMP-binding flagellar brake protein YcgR